MKWNKYKIKTTTQATDFLCGILIALKKVDKRAQ